jgi:predicted Zn-dependent protease
MNSGYARSLENEADGAAVQILARAGYNPRALVDLLSDMKPRLAADARGFGKTHPSPEDRIQHVSGLLGALPASGSQGLRRQRFEAVIGMVR